MRFFNKIAGAGVAFSIATVAAVWLLLSGPAQNASAAAVGSIFLVCPDTATAGASQTITCNLGFDTASTYSEGANVDGVEVTVTTVLGTWAANNQSSLTFQCGNIGVVDNCTNNLTLVLNVGTSTGTNTVVASAGGAVDTEEVTVGAATSSDPTASISFLFLSHDNVGYTSSLAGFNPLINGAFAIFMMKDANGTGVAANRLVEFTVDGGVLFKMDNVFANTAESTLEDTCDSTSGKGTTVIDDTYTSSTTGAGSTIVVFCANSGASGGSVTITATVVDNPTLTATKTINVSKKPGSADITATVDGTKISVEVFKDGIAGPDDTDVRFAVVPTTDGQAVSSCVSLHDGKASTDVAVAAGKTVTVLITINEVTESAAECDATPGRTYGSIQVSMTAGAAAAVPTTPTGDANVLPLPPGGSGITVGVSGTNDIDALIAAQGCNVASVFVFDVATQSWTWHIVGALFGNTLNLAADSIVNINCQPA